MRHVLSLVVIAVVASPALGNWEPVSDDVAPDSPHLTVTDASHEERNRLRQAIARFEQRGLLLPQLTVGFHDDKESCNGHAGLFASHSLPWHISICDSEHDYVYEHELAHAWLRANVTVDTRRRFMDLRSYSAWSDHSLPWSRRGVEGAAFVLQQGLSGLPLPPVHSAEVKSRLAAFELLTGIPDPRLAQWTAQYRTSTLSDSH